MGQTFIWEMRSGKDHYRDIRNILVSSIKIDNNRLICSLLQEGWVVIKIIIRHKKENAYYQYCLGKPDLKE